MIKLTWASLEGDGGMGSGPPGHITSGYMFSLKYWYGPLSVSNWTNGGRPVGLSVKFIDD